MNLRELHENLTGMLDSEGDTPVVTGDSINGYFPIEEVSVTYSGHVFLEQGMNEADDVEEDQPEESGRTLRAGGRDEEERIGEQSQPV